MVTLNSGQENAMLKLMAIEVVKKGSLEAGAFKISLGPPNGPHPVHCHIPSI